MGQTVRKPDFGDPAMGPGPISSLVSITPHSWLDMTVSRSTDFSQASQAWAFREVESGLVALGT
jgi:hypothetical protein